MSDDTLSLESKRDALLGNTSTNSIDGVFFGDKGKGSTSPFEGNDGIVADLTEDSLRRGAEVHMFCSPFECVGKVSFEEEKVEEEEASQMEEMNLSVLEGKRERKEEDARMKIIWWITTLTLLFKGTKSLWCEVYNKKSKYLLNIINTVMSIGNNGESGIRGEFNSRTWFASTSST